MPQPKGDLDISYFGTPGAPLCGGVDYSRPYTALEPQFLAPGTVNTSQHNGYLCSSPWMGQSPYSTPFANNEWVMGISPSFKTLAGGGEVQLTTIIVTNIAVYQAQGPGSSTASALTQGSLNLVHTFGPGELSAQYTGYGNTLSFVEVSQILFIAGPAINGILAYNFNTSTFGFATTYVSATYLIELNGRLFGAQCRFPGGGGTGTALLNTVAWSGVGAFIGSGGSDPWNPANGLGGGFAQLQDTPDAITGLANIGRSAIIFRQNGLSQADPNSSFQTSGIQPFTFYHLWSSFQGIGAFEGSVAQYGDKVIFRADDNVYVMSISGGLAPVGTRVIERIQDDYRTANTQRAITDAADNINLAGFWYFGSIVDIEGQLHYLLTFTSYTVDPSVSLTPITKAFVYDYNLSEQAWHVWDSSTYVRPSSASTPAFLGFSCAITQTSDFFLLPVATGPPQATAYTGQNYLMFGSFTGYGTIAAQTLAGVLNIFVPAFYGFTTNPITSYVANLYVPVALPQTTIVFRGENFMPGRKNTSRRFRFQADNAPIQGAPAGAQQTAQVNVQGANSSQTGGLIPMAGNAATAGLPIQTYYGDFSLSDETVQVTLKGVVLDTANANKTLPGFRLASAGIVLNDTVGSQQ